MDNLELKILKAYLQIKNSVEGTMKSLRFNLNNIDLNQMSINRIEILLKTIQMSCEILIDDAEHLYQSIFLDDLKQS